MGADIMNWLSFQDDGPLMALVATTTTNFPYIAKAGLPAAYHPGATAKRGLRNVGVGFMPTRCRFTENRRHLSLLSGT
ncbi:MAG: hypothetical protein V2J25_02740 [Desulfatiglans sp.]|jgi:hypothetical protein|nr:hypothetical protein [Desulfatiglans sp.]